MFRRSLLTRWLPLLSVGVLVGAGATSTSRYAEACGGRPAAETDEVFGADESSHPRNTEIWIRGRHLDDGDSLDVTIDGQPASLVHAQPRDDFKLAMRIQPTPPEGSTVVVSGAACSVPDYCMVSQTFTATAPDDVLPEAPTAVTVAFENELTGSPGNAPCRPFGLFLRGTADVPGDMTTTPFLLVETFSDEMLQVPIFVARATRQPGGAFGVFADELDADDYARVCVRVSGLDRAGNVSAEHVVACGDAGGSAGGGDTSTSTHTGGNGGTGGSSADVTPPTAEGCSCRIESLSRDDGPWDALVLALVAAVALRRSRRG